MWVTFEIQKLSLKWDKQGLLFVFNIINNVKCKDSKIINFVNFKVRKNNLRMLQKDRFNFMNSISPINRMLAECNKFLSEYLDVDFFERCTDMMFRKILE